MTSGVTLNLELYTKDKKNQELLFIAPRILANGLLAVEVL